MVSRRNLVTAFLLATLAALSTVGTANHTAFAVGSPVHGPALAGVSVRLPAESAVTTTGVVWKNGAAWFAVAVNHELRIYRWREHWVLDGTLNLPPALPGPYPGGELGSTTVTGGVAPDFTSRFVGADTQWFALAARLAGQWQIVPFDDQYKRRNPYTFAYGASQHLIHGIFDACGCASGPTTEQWYRYARGVFVPTKPPGQPAPCTATALASVGHWPPLPDDPLVRNVDQPLRVLQFACANGWALATDGHRVGVYEQHGRRLNQPAGRQWLRVGVGSPHLLGSEVDFALPRSMLQRLGREIGVQIPPAPREPTYPPAPPLTRRQKAPITATFRPGDDYAAPDLTRQPSVLVVSITSGTRTRVIRYRWQNGGWVRVPTR